MTVNIKLSFCDNLFDNDWLSWGLTFPSTVLQSYQVGLQQCCFHIKLAFNSIASCQVGLQQYCSHIKMAFNLVAVISSWPSTVLQSYQVGLQQYCVISSCPSTFGVARWLSGRVSDSGARGPGFETYRRRVVSLSKTLYSPKVLVNYPGSDGSVPTWLKNCWLGC